VEDIKRLIGDRIRNLRKERGLSQEELGWKSELHHTYIGAVERGEKNCSIDTLSKIGTGLDVSINDLFDFPTYTQEVDTLKTSIIKAMDQCSPEVLKLVLRPWRSSCTLKKGLNDLNHHSFLLPLFPASLSRSGIRPGL